MHIWFFMRFETLMEVLCLNNKCKLNYNRVMKRLNPIRCNKSYADYAHMNIFSLSLFYLNKDTD